MWDADLAGVYWSVTGAHEEVCTVAVGQLRPRGTMALVDNQPTDGAASPPEPPVVDAELVDDTAMTVAEPAAPVLPATDYTDAGVPTFDYVRDRIEQRVGTTIGATELAEESAPAISLDEQMAERDRAGREKLEQIRKSMRGE